MALPTVQKRGVRCDGTSRSDRDEAEGQEDYKPDGHRSADGEKTNEINPPDTVGGDRGAARREINSHNHSA